MEGYEEIQVSQVGPLALPYLSALDLAGLLGSALPAADFPLPLELSFLDRIEKLLNIQISVGMQMA